MTEDLNRLNVTERIDELFYDNNEFYFSIDSFLNDCDDRRSIGEFVDELLRIQNLALLRGYTNIGIIVENEEDYYADDEDEDEDSNRSFFIIGDRPETDDEYKERLEFLEKKSKKKAYRKKRRNYPRTILLDC